MVKIKFKAQSWSIDVALGVLVFIVAFFIVYALSGSNPNEKASSLKQDASVVIKQVSSQQELNDLKSSSYKDLKQKFKVDGDFCIYLEDEKGNLIPMGNQRGIGSSDITLAGLPCQ